MVGQQQSPATGSARESWKRSYLYALGLFAAALPISIAINAWVAPMPSLAFIVAIVLVARLGRMGPTILLAVLSALVLEYVFLPPKAEIRIVGVAAICGAMLIVALIVKRMVDDLRTAERASARLEGVQLAAGEIADRLGNSLALASTTVELMEDLPDISPEHRKLLATCRARLREAGQDLRKLQRVSHVEVRETSLGPVLDLDRSAELRLPVASPQPAREHGASKP